jgi:hypothetical protein
MKIDKIIELSKDIGKNLSFQFTNAQGDIIKGCVIDAHFEIFTIDGADGFITLEMWKKVTNDIFDFEIINPEQ